VLKKGLHHHSPDLGIFRDQRDKKYFLNIFFNFFLIYMAHHFSTLQADLDIFKGKHFEVLGASASLRVLMNFFFRKSERNV
jgi:hypothetical protein